MTDMPFQLDAPGIYKVQLCSKSLLLVIICLSTACVPKRRVVCKLCLRT